MVLSPLEAIEQAERVVSTVSWLERYALDLDEPGVHPGLVPELRMVACAHFREVASAGS